MNDVLTCYYDLHVSPPTYDIVSFLCRCEQERVRLGCKSIRIVMLPGPAGGFRRDKLWPHSIEERVAMRDNVAVPLCRLLPSCVEVRVATVRADRVEPSIGCCSPLYGLGVFVATYRAGVRPLRSRVEVVRDSRLVTITLREAWHWPERNSQIDQWVRAADAIERAGYRVVFVRDTVRASSRVADFEVNPLASTDIDERARLYASAAVNMGISNGPLWMALAMDVPVIMLRPCDNSLLHVFGEAYFELHGVKPRQQMPGAPAYQRLVWGDDATENIVGAFEEFFGSAKQARVA